MCLPSSNAERAVESMQTEETTPSITTFSIDFFFNIAFSLVLENALRPLLPGISKIVSP